MNKEMNASAEEIVEDTLPLDEYDGQSINVQEQNIEATQLQIKQEVSAFEQAQLAQETESKIESTGNFNSVEDALIQLQQPQEEEEEEVEVVVEVDEEVETLDVFNGDTDLKTDEVYDISIKNDEDTESKLLSLNK